MMLSVYRAERRKLLAQLSTRVLALVCVLGPLGFGAILSQQSALPADTLLGVWVHASGYAVSFVVLGFGGYLAFPILAGVLAGDLFSSEDRYGTWKTVLTRSRSRRDVFLGKVLAAGTLALALIALAAISSILTGLLFTGDQPLVGLGGNVLSSGEGLWLVLVSWLLNVPALLAFTSLALLFSVATRNGIVGVLGPVLVGLLMQLLELIGSGSWVHTLLVASAFNDWHGLLSAPRFYGPLIVGNCVCVLWVVVCLGASWLILRRRDFAGAPARSRAGWVLPVRAVLGCAALIVVLAAATSLGPVAITQARLEASISSAFNDLTVLQQQELGRLVPKGAKLKLHTICARHAGKSQGPGDDWTCTMTVITPLPGFEPFLATPVIYDMSVKSDGCYKAEAPPSFVGQQLMTDAHGRSVVNPLYVIYGCFDTTGAPVKCAEGSICEQTTSTSPTPPSASKPKPPTAAREAERKALQKAEKEAGPAVVQEVGESEQKEKRAAENPRGEAEGEAGK
jgi:ABC-2 type transport system permease protein